MMTPTILRKGKKQPVGFENLRVLANLFYQAFSNSYSCFDFVVIIFQCQCLIFLCEEVLVPEC